MIGLQEYIINNNISVPILAKELGIQPGAIWRWFQINRVPENRIHTLANKFELNEEYINKKVNDISTYRPKHKGFNNYKICGNYTIIYLETKNEGVKETIIDTEDLDMLKKLNYCWHRAKIMNSKDSEPLYYVMASVYDVIEDGKKKSRTVCLHDIIMGGQSNKDIHINHIDHNTLDNRKYNLEVVPCKINIQLRDKPNCNTNTGVRNVHKVKYNNKEIYRVQIMKDYKHHKWDFALNEFEEACEFARQKRIEFFGLE